MSLWRTIRGEMAGAWRSVCYDLRRHPAGSSDPEPDVTCTGMNTFPGSLVDPPAGQPETDARPPRRIVAVAAFCGLAACGAAGSYLIATTAFAGRMTDPPAAPAIAAPAPPGLRTGFPPGSQPTKEATAKKGAAAMGEVPATPRRMATAPATPGSPAPARPRAAAPRTPAAVGTGVATRVVTRPETEAGSTGDTPAPTAEPECHCEPPVPTPTAPSPAPSAPAPPSVSPSASTSGTPAEPGAGDPAPPSPDGSSPTRESDRRHHDYRH